MRRDLPTALSFLLLGGASPGAAPPAPAVGSRATPGDLPTLTTPKEPPTMPASAGTPTIFEKIAAAFGFGPAIGLTPTEVQAIQAGDQRDFTKAEQAAVVVLKPILTTGEAEAQAALVNFLTAVLANIPTITSLGNAVDIVMGALKAESGPLLTQAEKLGQSAFAAVVGAALAAVGKVNIPA